MKGQSSMKPREQGCVESPGQDGRMDKRDAGSEVFSCYSSITEGWMRYRLLSAVV